jgi:hypothetical protein
MAPFFTHQLDGDCKRARLAGTGGTDHDRCTVGARHQCCGPGLLGVKAHRVIAAFAQPLDCAINALSVSALTTLGGALVKPAHEPLLGTQQWLGAVALKSRLAIKDGSALCAGLCVLSFAFWFFGRWCWCWCCGS